MKRQKRTRSNQQIPHEVGLLVEGLQLVQQLDQPAEGDWTVSHTQGELPN
jgi:hypothetical protein